MESQTLKFLRKGHGSEKSHLQGFLWFKKVSVFFALNFYTLILQSGQIVQSVTFLTLFS